MTRTELIQAMQAQQEELLALLDSADPAALVEPGACGEWAVKDLLVHISLWRAELVTTLLMARMGQKPTSPILTRDHAATNQTWYDSTKDRPYERVREDLEGVLKQLIRRLNEMNEADLVSAGRYPWMNKRSLLELAEFIGFAHPRTHVEQIRAWLQKQTPAQ